MTIYDYKVVPAPSKGAKARGVKGPGARLAQSFETMLNDMAGDGWEFQRAETLPSEERQGLAHSSTTFRTFLVFRRPRPGDTGTVTDRHAEDPAAPAAETSAEPDVDRVSDSDEDR